MKAIHSCSTGSSPHVRGKRAPRGLGLPGFRLIPACAGKTFSAQEFGPCQSAHPRVCGENWPARVSVSLAKGSSSRVRGKLTGELIHRRSAGLIPACAGKTNRIASLVSNLPAHPRVCGENGIRRGKPTSPPGSSPRVRGKRRGRIRRAACRTGSPPSTPGSILRCTPLQGRRLDFPECLLRK